MKTKQGKWMSRNVWLNPSQIVYRTDQSILARFLLAPSACPLVPSLAWAAFTLLDWVPKYSKEAMGSGFIVFEPSFQFAGQTSPCSSYTNGRACQKPYIKEPRNKGWNNELVWTTTEKMTTWSGRIKHRRETGLDAQQTGKPWWDE